MNMKGKKCPYKDIICQEGYCKDCQIYLDFQKGGINAYCIHTNSSRACLAKAIALELPMDSRWWRFMRRWTWIHLKQTLTFLWIVLRWKD